MIRIPTLALSCFLFATTVFADSAQVDMQAYVANPLQVTMAVVNRGPDVARNSFLTIDFPSELDLDRVVSVYGPCDYTQRPVRCSLGDIPVFAPPVTFAYYMGANFKGPFVDATYSVKFTVSSDTPDPNPSSN